MRVSVPQFRMTLQRRLFVNTCASTQWHDAIDTERTYQDYPNLRYGESLKQVAGCNHRIAEQFCRRAFQAGGKVENQRYVRNGSGAGGTRSQVSVAELDLSILIRSR